MSQSTLQNLKNELFFGLNKKKFIKVNQLADIHNELSCEKNYVHIKHKLECVINWLPYKISCIGATLRVALEPNRSSILNLTCHTYRTTNCPFDITISIGYQR
jgi:hypothetical protein